jgi:hypothetical protein
VDYFLHVLTAADATLDSPSPVSLEETDRAVRVRTTKATLTFDKNKLLGSIEIDGQRPVSY